MGIVRIIILFYKPQNDTLGIFLELHIIGFFPHFATLLVGDDIAQHGVDELSIGALLLRLVAGAWDDVIDQLQTVTRILAEKLTALDNTGRYLKVNTIIFQERHHVLGSRDRLSAFDQVFAALDGVFWFFVDFYLVFFQTLLFLSHNFRRFFH